MADVSGNVLKRPHPEDEDSNSQKRSRSNNGSPLPASSGAPAGKVDIDKMVAEARAKAEAVRARLQAARGGTPGISSGASSPSPAPPAASPAMSRLEQMRARVAAATGKVTAATPQRPPPAASTLGYQPHSYDDEGLSKARGGLDVGLHPALLADSVQDNRGSKGRQAMQPRFATTMANRRTESPVPVSKAGNEKPGLDLSGPSLEEIRQNPYYDGSLNATAKARHSKHLVFNQKGKYIQQGAILRRQTQMEEMKKRIASMARQAGVDEDMGVERAFEVPEPPPLEWWDEELVNGNDYSAIADPKNIKLDTDNTMVTIYIQHPVLLDPPQDKLTPAQKPMYLTSKEQAKLRRQRRMADLKEQQAKIRLGLEPAPPPKVKKSNMMRVLGEEAVKDPTAVEARVNREIAERLAKHETSNEERKLTKEQRHEKLAAQQEKDAEKGIFVCVFRIDNLSNGRHRFKISKNAEQMMLTGVCVMHPKLNVVVVEGGFHSIKQYKKVMLNRIDWTENSGPAPQQQEGNREPLASWLSPEDEKGELRDLGSNSCVLLWEGQEKARSFRKWLGARVCETDAAAKETLTRAKMESFWTLAKSHKQAV